MLLHILVGNSNGKLRKDSKIVNEIAQSSNLKIAQRIFTDIVP
jgi:hypothetical protein